MPAVIWRLLNQDIFLITFFSLPISIIDLLRRIELRQKRISAELKKNVDLRPNRNSNVFPILYPRLALFCCFCFSFSFNFFYSWSSKFPGMIEKKIVKSLVFGILLQIRVRTPRGIQMRNEPGKNRRKKNMKPRFITLLQFFFQK